MSDGENQTPSTRRNFLTAALAAAGAAVAGSLPARAANQQPPSPPSPAQRPPERNPIEPFWGDHQGGILTHLQSHTYFAALDLTTTRRQDVIDLLRQWTAAAARMSTGSTADTPAQNPANSPADSGEAMDLSPSRLTLTFGFGPGLFVKDGHDRFNLKSRRPEPLIDLPTFNGDQLIESKTGGDLSIQACAEDPQVAFHAVRQLIRLAYGAAQVRWAQTGFLPDFTGRQTPRNLMGFKDGTNNPPPRDQNDMNQFVWVANEGPDWMRGGSYLVARRIRIALEHWDRVSVAFQEQTIGRQKVSGAPLGGTSEHDRPDYQAVDNDGNFLIPDNSHIRLAGAPFNGGIKILRRPYSYNDGVNFTSERWPPWRQGTEYDAGLFFLAYQRDPREGFIKIFDQMSKLDMLNQFTTHTGSALFAVPGGIAEGEYVGQRLFA